MQRIIFIFIIQITTSIAFDFIMTPSGGLTPVSEPVTTVTETTTSTSNNQYLEAVELPECDEMDPEVQFITSNEDWSTINNTNKRIFCVSPGDYSSLKNINLSVSGSAESRRYIILNNGNNTHPAQLSENELAFFSLKFNGASYWTIDRGSWMGTSVGVVYQMINGASFNTINRSYVHKNACTVEIKEFCHNNTIQNSRIEEMAESARKSDIVVIRLISFLTNFEIKNTKILNNEIKNTGDCFQTVLSTVSGDNKQNGNAEGTIIDNNHFYIDNTIYTDGAGNYTPSGAYAYAENAIDLKFGSKNAQNPLLITNNHMWGYRKSDKTDSYTGDPGYAIVLHYDIGNAKINNNIIFDSNAGLGASDKQDYNYAFHSSEVKQNIFYDCGQVYGSSQTTYPVLIGSSNSIDFSENSIINGRNNSMFFGFNASEMSVTSNDTINCEGGMLLQSNTGGLYDTPNIEGSSYTSDYTFSTDNFTNSPRSITLNNAIKGN